MRNMPGSSEGRKGRRMKEYIGRDLHDECGNVVGREYSGELIRCKDCAHYHHFILNEKIMRVCADSRGCVTPRANGFCVYGKRKVK